MLRTKTNLLLSENEQWITQDELQLFFKISRSTVYRWCKQNQLAYTVMGGTRYFPKQFTLNLLAHKLKNKELINNEEVQ
ncbi:helix-turn-helix domain-containing protein [Gaetbulibacter saemankumensis]|jgi:predicted DNA-binding transcriptional regulator AlpA|uniref:helix-turn-helix domain-containing protein n=1 Tax=Gaetbulibacter saemankumensis TaxID=311208 RepID=UPI00048112F5|nr:helix-turn-helix domain-containing protein [Gaetbulibacter saemankumensis]